MIKGVPADICNNRGEYYLAEDITGHVCETAEDAVRSGVEVQVVRYAA